MTPSKCASSSSGWSRWARPASSSRSSQGGRRRDRVRGRREVEVHSDWKPGDPLWRGTVDGVDIAVQARPILNGYVLSHAGVTVDARVYTRREAELAALMIERKGADGSRFLLCPMPGLVKAIAVKVGQEVKAGEQLCIVEAMKMENVLTAERDATVKAILAKEGDRSRSTPSSWSSHERAEADFLGLAVREDIRLFARGSFGR